MPSIRYGFLLSCKQPTLDIIYFNDNRICLVHKTFMCLPPLHLETAIIFFDDNNSKVQFVLTKGFSVLQLLTLCRWHQNFWLCLFCLQFVLVYISPKSSKMGWFCRLGVKIDQLAPFGVSLMEFDPMSLWWDVVNFPMGILLMSKMYSIQISL